VGNNIGSRKFAVAKIYGYETAKLGTYYTVFIGLVFMIFPYFTLSIITEDKSIMGMAAPALRIAGFAQIFYATGVVLANGLQAANRTFFVMMSEVVSNLFIFVPLSFLFGKILGFGLLGAWSALPIYIILYSSILLWKFRRDNWEHIRT
ncbi:MAG: MATE family efflux transporter, partial [Bacteroidota bacterium]|nr:MATE family efflux transporter [Bacteroidota bacterium]